MPEKAPAERTVVVEKRIFCKYLCPVGLLLRFTSAIPSPLRYKVRATETPCTECQRCNKACLMGLEPMKDITTFGEVRSPDCINCLECVSKCPKGAIDFSRAARSPEKSEQPAALPISALAQDVARSVDADDLKPVARSMVGKIWSAKIYARRPAR